MNSKKLMEAVEVGVRINGLLEPLGWEMIQFTPKASPWRDGARLELEIAPIGENPNCPPKARD
jgi:hypothetical protein